MTALSVSFRKSYSQAIFSFFTTLGCFLHVSSAGAGVSGRTRSAHAIRPRASTCVAKSN